MRDKLPLPKMLVILALALAALLAGVYLLGSHMGNGAQPRMLGPLGETSPPALLLYCGAGLRPPVEDAIELFERRSGARIEVDYGASNILLSRLKLTRRGDVFLPGDAFYVAEARREGLVAEERAVAWFVPVVMVPKGNSRNIQGIADLAAPGVRLGLADERAAAIGRITPDIFRANGVPLDAVRRNTVFTSVTAPELAQAVALGHVDAAIVWRPMAVQHLDRAEIVEIPSETNVVSPVSVAVLESAAHADAARAFVEFLAGPMGQASFARHRYRPAAEDSAP